MTAQQTLHALLRDLQDECAQIAAEQRVPEDHCHRLTRAAYDAYMRGSDFGTALDAARQAAAQYMSGAAA